MKHIAIVGAGASGLMAAERLAAYPNLRITVFEQMPSAGRKLLWAGKTGLNLSNTQPLDEFLAQYRPSVPFIRQAVAGFDCHAIQHWCQGLGVETFIGSSGRLFPKAMKAAPLLRAWLKRLFDSGVGIRYHSRVVGIDGKMLSISDSKTDECYSQAFDAIVLACGGGSYAKLGSTGAWSHWFGGDFTPFYASNVGVLCAWSKYMTPFFGCPIKSVVARCGDTVKQGDIMLSHYGLEGGVIYALNHALRYDDVLFLDLLPDVDEKMLVKKLAHPTKSLSTRLKNCGLDKVKTALFFECYHPNANIARQLKNLPITTKGTRPIAEAISTGGGVARSAINERLQLKQNEAVFCVGEMLDWDAPTGGYLLTACLAMGVMVGDCVAQYLDLEPNHSSTSV